MMLLKYTAMSSPPNHGDGNTSQQNLQGQTPLVCDGNDPARVGRLNQPNGGGWPPLMSSTISSSPYQMAMSRQPAQQPLLGFGSSFNHLVSSLSCAGVGSNPFASKQIRNDPTTPSTQLPDPKSIGKDGNKSIPCNVVPCRARGMPKDHNNKTAFFAIPHNIAHGEGLRCSHKGCREKGIRFRYCSVCAVPVAKRNFSTRHLHGDLLEKSIREENGLVMKRSEADEVLAKRREVISNEKKGKRKVTRSSSADTCNSSEESSSIREENGLVMKRSEADEVLAKRCEVMSNEKKGKRKVTSSSSAADTCNSSEESSISSSSSASSDDSDKDGSCKNSKPLKKRRRKDTGRSGDSNGEDLETYPRRYHGEWMKLLARRPRGGETLDAWLNEVMALSDKMTSNPALRARVEDLHASVVESPI